MKLDGDNLLNMSIQKVAKLFSTILILCIATILNCQAAEEPRAISAELAPLLEKAYNELKEGKNSNAVKTLDKAIKLDEESITTRRYSAYALIMDNQPKNALKQLDFIVKKIKKPTYFEWCTYGEAYLKARAGEQARTCFENALLIAPTSTYVKSGLVRAKAITGNLDDALELAKEGMKVSKTNESYDYFKDLFNQVRLKQARTAKGDNSSQ